MAERDERGRFVPGSAAEFGRKGGSGKRVKISPEDLAMLQAALAGHAFGGDVAAAGAWMAARGLVLPRRRKGKATENVSPARDGNTSQAT